MKPCFALLLLAPLAACAGAGSGGGGRYSGLSCAPFARELTGLQLSGDAASWWEQADGRYARLHRPEVGSVLVFSRSARLPSGHVSVVSRMHDARRIEVIQANWVPGQVARDQLVVDVSQDNDWSLVRVWYPPIGALGSHPYPAYGFVRPGRPLGHDALLAEAGPAAARLSRD